MTNKQIIQELQYFLMAVNIPSPRRTELLTLLDMLKENLNIKDK